jgi:hypothetical protein
MCTACLSPSGGVLEADKNAIYTARAINSKPLSFLDKSLSLEQQKSKNEHSDAVCSFDGSEISRKTTKSAIPCIYWQVIGS